MKIINITILILIIVTATGCTSRKKLPFIPIDFPGYEWSSNQDGVIFGRAVGETEVRYDVNADGRVENVRFSHGMSDLPFNHYLKEKMLDDWRFEENHPQQDASLTVTSRQ
ncbi:hypothetical protein ABEH87_06590 [Erwinia sp. Eh17-17]|uniref:hypothetical protein n=1 Tax=Erwinia sp. Eh17-17 TaxID=3080330 RepID=UPI0032079964